MLTRTTRRSIDLADASIGPRQAAATAPRVESTWLAGGQSYVVCAFYTPSYEDKAIRLKTSLERLGINHHIERYEPRATWEATTRLKPGFIVECLDRFRDFDIAYIDADGVVHTVPRFFETVSTDVAMLFAPVKARGRRRLSLASGTLLVRNTAGGRRFAAVWRDEEPRNGPLSLDEDLLYGAFPNLEGVTFTALPRAYSKIFDSPGGVAVIEHFQASRDQLKLSGLARRAVRTGRVIGFATLGLLAAVGLSSLIGPIG